MTMEINLYEIRALFQWCILGTDGMNGNIKSCKLLIWKMGAKFISSWTFCCEGGNFVYTGIYLKGSLYCIPVELLLFLSRHLRQETLRFLYIKIHVIWRAYCM
jgi:hypothetical protein